MTESASRHSQFLSFIERLSQSARENTDVLGLVLVGSAAETFRADEWSDHDFFLIVNPTCGEKFRSDLSWLPSVDEIAFSARETDHGLKVVYKNAHVLEFAVFEDIELELASVNSWLSQLIKQISLSEFEQSRREPTRDHLFLKPNGDSFSQRF